METDRSAQVRSMEEQIVQCMEEGRYEDVEVIGKDILPFLANESLSVRLRIYHLLKRCPGFHLSAIHQWNARAVAEDVMADSKRTPEDRIRAHMLSLRLNVFSLGTSPPEGSTVDPQRRWLPRELKELYAEQAATELLGRGGGGDPAIIRDAHIVRCFTCPDHRSVEAHLEALLADGDEEAIVMGCVVAPQAFHQETACRFLNRALAVVKKEKAIARLLDYKLCILSECYQDGPGEKTQESVERYRALYKDFITTMARLELCPNAPVERAFGHLYFAALAYWYAEEALVEIHCDVAKALADHLQDPILTRAVEYSRKWMLSEEKSAVQEGDDEDEEEKEGGSYEDEDDDDDDDDDKEDFWKKS